jgi:hypothetical protein
MIEYDGMIEDDGLRSDRTDIDNAHLSARALAGEKLARAINRIAAARERNAAAITAEAAAMRELQAVYQSGSAKKKPPQRELHETPQRATIERPRRA